MILPRKQGFHTVFTFPFKNFCSSWKQDFGIVCPYSAKTKQMQVSLYHISFNCFLKWLITEMLGLLSLKGIMILVIKTMGDYLLGIGKKIQTFENKRIQQLILMMAWLCKQLGLLGCMCSEKVLLITRVSMGKAFLAACYWTCNSLIEDVRDHYYIYQFICPL